MHKIPMHKIETKHADSVQRQIPQATYTVTIRREAGEYIARDAAGHWRARGKAEDCDVRTPVTLALSLFHACEILAIRPGPANGFATVEILGG